MNIVKDIIKVIYIITDVVDWAAEWRFYEY